MHPCPGGPLLRSLFFSFPPYAWDFPLFSPAFSEGFLSKGVVLGSREAVQEVVDLYRAKGIYTRRRNPIPQLGGALYTLTEERTPSEKAGEKRGKS